MSGSAPERRTSWIAGDGLFATSDAAPEALVLTLDRDVAGAIDLGAINHSCDPTLGFVDARRLVARRSISADDELTVDYATCETDPGYLLRCHCETYRCRQVIEGTDWQIPQLQKRYTGAFAPNVQALIDAT